MHAAEILRQRPALWQPLAGLAAASARAALRHAGWLVQAQLGMTLSWSWFGGLGGVALWWALLALWPAPRSRPAPAALAAAAVAACAGLVLAMQMGRSTAGWLGWALHLLAWSWLCRPLGSGGGGASQGVCWLGMLGGWLLAAGLAASQGLWLARWPLLAGLLLLAPWLVEPEPPAGAPPWADAMVRPDPAMGLMMGSLLPMNEWCASAGWSGPLWLTLHLCAMVAGAWLVSRGAVWRRHRFSPAWAWAAAALLCLQGGPGAMLAAAALVGAGSALGRCPRAGSRGWALAGCTLLLALGHWGATWGPDALRLALLLALWLAMLSCLPARLGAAS